MGSPKLCYEHNGRDEKVPSRRRWTTETILIHSALVTGVSYYTGAWGTCRKPFATQGLTPLMNQEGGMPKGENMKKQKAIAEKATELTKEIMAKVWDHADGIIERCRDRTQVEGYYLWTNKNTNGKWNLGIRSNTMELPKFSHEPTHRAVSTIYYSAGSKDECKAWTYYCVYRLLTGDYE